MNATVAPEKSQQTDDRIPAWEWQTNLILQLAAIAGYLVVGSARYRVDSSTGDLVRWRSGRRIW